MQVVASQHLAYGCRLSIAMGAGEWIEAETIDPMQKQLLSQRLADVPISQLHSAAPRAHISNYKITKPYDFIDLPIFKSEYKLLLL